MGKFVKYQKRPRSRIDLRAVGRTAASGAVALYKGYRMAKNFKNNMSVSKTTKREPKKIQFIKSTGTGITFSKCSKFNKMSKRNKAALAGKVKDTWSFVSTAASLSDYGEQGTSTLVNCGTGTEIASAITNANNTNATNVALNARTVNSNDRDVYLHSMTNQVTIGNASTDNVIIWAYDVICKKDYATSLLPSTSFALGVDDTEGLSPDQDNDTVGSWPNLSSSFMKTWRIIKRTRIELSAGRDHTHTFTYGVNRRINSTETSAYTMIKGVTMNTMFLHYGLPCSNNNTWAIPSIVTMNRTKLLYVHTRRWVTSNLDSKALKNTHQVTNLPNATVVGAATMRTIQDQSGDAEVTSFA